MLKTLLTNARSMAALLAAAGLLLANISPTFGAGKSEDAAVTVHFTAAYDNSPGPGGYWICAGERITKTGPKAFTKDSETCIISDLDSLPPPGIYHYCSQCGDTPWWSDYDGLLAVSVTFVVTDNGDGTGTVQVEAYY